MTMRPAVFHPWIYLRGGIERTLLELVTRSRHEWQIYAGRYIPDQTFEEFRDLNVIETGHFSTVRRIGPMAKACAQLMLPRTEWSKHDALLVSCDGVGNLLTFGAGKTPIACLCHTPLRVAYDTTIEAQWRRTMHPDLPTRLGVKLFTYADRLAWRRYDRVFCVSQEVRRRILQHHLAPPQKLEVLHPGVDIDRFVPTGRRERFFLVPGRIAWTKNVDLAIDAFIRLKDVLAEGGGGDLRLVIAGALDEKSRPHFAALQAMAAGRGDIEFIVSPNDDELLDLYDRCLAVLFPPLNEDWGLVPLEAMAFGKPVIAVDRGGPAESIANGETGFLCPPTPEAFSTAMALMFSSTSRLDDMAIKARLRAETFHWTRFVKRLDDYVESVGTKAGQEPAMAAP